jgi:hypothetical protein
MINALGLNAGELALELLGVDAGGNDGLPVEAFLALALLLHEMPVGGLVGSQMAAAGPLEPFLGAALSLSSAGFALVGHKFDLRLTIKD